MSPKLNEDQYWSDFFAGRSLDKYGVTTVNQWFVDYLTIDATWWGIGL